LAANVDSPVAIQRLDKTDATDQFPFLQEAGRLISDVLNINLVDDGTSGDQMANDGSYSAVFRGTKIEGSSVIHVTAEGKTAGGVPFSRQGQVTGIVNVGVSGDLSLVTIDKLDREDFVRDYYRIVVTPMDRRRNRLIPGYAKLMKMDVARGSRVGEVTNHLNGEYSRVVALNKSEDPREMQLSIVIGDVAIMRYLAKQFLTRDLLLVLIVIALVVLAVGEFVLYPKKRVGRTSI
jgi:hypothetical protein